MEIMNMFNKPKIICLIGDTNTGKSMCLYHLIEELKKIGQFDLYTYGLKEKIKGSRKIYSVEELEQVTNSIVILDEVMSMWDLNNRMEKKKIENTLRLIHHNNNILVICALPENVRKFIAGKINMYILKKCTIADFVNGSKSKYVVTNYRGVEKGSNILNLKIDEALVFDGLHYEKIHIPYYPKYDTKKGNVQIVKKFVKKNVKKKVNKKKVKSVKDGRRDMVSKE